MTDDIRRAGPAAPGRKRPRWLIPLMVLAVAALVGAAGLYWFFSGDAPAEVDLSATADAVTASTAADHLASPTTTGQRTSGVAGSWTVDTTVGEFSIDEDTTATFAGFRVEEVLSGIGSTTAVGRTPAVSGTVVLDATTVVDAKIVVDLTRIVSNESRRERPIQQALGTSANPEATFELTEPIDLTDDAAAGAVVSVVAVGDLTVNGVTNRVEIPMEAQLLDDKILIVASTDIVFADYGVAAPRAPIVVSVEDRGILELQLWLSR